MAAAAETISTPITKLLGIKHPIILAGMGNVAGPELAAAVTNAGGLGVMGGVGYTPKMLRQIISEMKEALNDRNAPFGIDLLLPKVGEGARKTNFDYTEGKLDELLDIMIEAGCKLFVSAVGIPPKWAVDKLHAASIPVMNMIGAPKHVPKALEMGVDIICAQGGEAGGHTGNIATSVLVPKVVDICRSCKSPLTGDPILVVAAGGISDGRGLAMALSLGASAVWVGTRFVNAEESSASKRHKEHVIKANYDDAQVTIIYSGRPLRVFATDYVRDWNDNRAQEIKELTARGKIPAPREVSIMEKKGEKVPFDARFPMLMGQAAGSITDVKPAAEIVKDMVVEAVSSSRAVASMISKL